MEAKRWCIPIARAGLSIKRSKELLLLARSWPSLRAPRRLLPGDERTKVCGVSRSACDPTVWTGRALQAESSKWQWLVLRFCIRPLRGADRSWPLWISARVRSHSRIGPQRPVGSPDHERDGETVPPSPQIQLADLGGCLLLLSGALGLTEALPSEPPSLARPDRRATAAEKGGGHPFGEPERAHVAATLRRASYSRCCTSTLHAMRASLLARAVASTLWCNR
jgi:hypothetical protein